MADPTCVNCGRVSKACRAFEGKECWQARALMLDRKVFALEQAALDTTAAATGEAGQVVRGEARDGQILLTVAFPDHAHLPGVGAKVRLNREVSRG